MVIVSFLTFKYDKDMSDKKMHLGPQINCVSYLIKQAFNSSFDNQKISGTESRLLFFISEHPSYTPSDIGKSLGITRATITEQMHDLTNKGLITYSSSENDKRKKIPLLTKDGYYWLDRSRQIIDSFEESLSSLLTKEEIEAMHSVYLKITNKFCQNKTCKNSKGDE